MSIDRERPHILRHTPDGLPIIEFNDQRGIYFNIDGNQVEPEIAAQAGFDIKVGARERRRAELYEKARREADAQLNSEYGRIDEEVQGELRRVDQEIGEASDEEIAAATKPPELPKFTYKEETVKKGGKDKTLFKIYAPDGEEVGTASSEEEAQLVADTLARELRQASQPSS